MRRASPVARGGPLLLLLALAACGGRDAREARNGTPAGGAADYALMDTAEYHGMTNSGRRALLRSPDGEVVDTVDLGFGVHVVGRDSVLLLPVRMTEVLGADTIVDVTEHVLLHGGRRVALKTLLPHFDDHFSSPAILDGRTLYYWGLGRDRDPLAMSYDFATGRIDSLGLGAVRVAGTDDRGYFSRPAREGEVVLYRMPEREWRWPRPRSAGAAR